MMEMVREHLGLVGVAVGLNRVTQLPGAWEKRSIATSHTDVGEI